jgi:hypothetical protein
MAQNMRRAMFPKKTVLLPERSKQSATADLTEKQKKNENGGGEKTRASPLRFEPSKICSDTCSL